MPESKNEEERDLSIETYLNQIERINLLLSDVDNYLSGKNSRFPKAELSSILREIVDNEMFELMILFMMTYYGIKKQLKNEAQYKDAIDGMRELMGWEKETSKNKINALEKFGLGIDNMAEGKSENALPYLKEASEIDPNNPIILIQLASAYSDIKDFANMNKYFKKSLEMENKFFESKIETTEEFDNLIKIFYEKRDLLKKINIKRESYENLLAKEPEILSSITILLEELIKYIDGEDNRISEKDIPYIMGDIIDDLFEYISIISGVCYFILKHNLGSEKEVSDILDALKYVIGYSEHQDLPFENINILDREHENVYQASRGKMPPPKPFIAPSISQPNTEHAKLLKTIEELVNKPIPKLNLVEYGSTGIRIKNGEIIELSLVSEGLSELPEDVCKINSLKKLIIRDDRLSYVPKCIERLSNLESLS
ncbi:MAG: hypothetical protein EU549_04700, partial [Promethearchaeota archaeon]